MKGQIIKIKSIEDTAVKIDNLSHLTEKDSESNFPEDNIPVSIIIDKESWKVWEKLYRRLRDKVH